MSRFLPKDAKTAPILSAVVAGVKSLPGVAIKISGGFCGNLIANIQPIKIALVKCKRDRASLYANRLLTERENKACSVKMYFVINVSESKISGLRLMLRGICLRK